MDEMRGTSGSSRKKGYRQPFDGKNELGSDQLAAAKKHMSRKLSTEQQTDGRKHGGGSGSKNEL